MNHKKLKEILVDFPNLVSNKGEKECREYIFEILSELSEVRKDLTKDQDLVEMNKFREAVHSYILQSDFCNHAYHKPYGYPGDFEAQEMIWNGRIHGKEYRYSGTSDTGRYINSLTLDMESSKANEHRVDKLRNYLLEMHPDCKVASIGCSSCLELWDLHKYRNSNIDFFLLDQEKSALDRARKKIVTNKYIKTTYHNANILKFIMNKNAPMEKKDLIYSFGLMDYFSVISAKKIVKRLFRFIKPGGKLLIINAHPDNPTKTWMEYTGGWFLEYKTKQELESILPKDSEIDDVTYNIDPYSVYQYLQVVKKQHQPI